MLQICSDVSGSWRVKDLEGEDVLKSEFCADIFDNVRLGYHIDEEHPVKAKNGVNNNHQTLLLECYADRCYVFGDMICLTLRFVHVLALDLFRCYSSGFLLESLNFCLKLKIWWWFCTPHVSSYQMSPFNSLINLVWGLSINWVFVISW